MSFKQFLLSVCNSLLKKKKEIVNDEKEEAVKNTKQKQLLVSVQFGSLESHFYYSQVIYFLIFNV